MTRGLAYASVLLLASTAAAQELSDEEQAEIAAEQRAAEQEAQAEERAQSRPAAEPEDEDGPDNFDFLWLEPFIGYSYVDLRALSSDNFFPEAASVDDVIRTYRGSGVAGGLGAGVRLWFLTLGARVTYARYPDGSGPGNQAFDVGIAAGEIGLVLPLEVVRPFLRVGFGYAWQGDGNFEYPSAQNVRTDGFAIQGALGVDVLIAEWFAIGAAFDVDFLSMSRQGIPGLDPNAPPINEISFQDPGDAVGVQVRGTCR